MLRRPLLWFYDRSYRRVMRPLLFRQDAQRAHHNVIEVLRLLDSLPGAGAAAGLLHRAAFSPRPLQAGGVNLPHPLILAAGFVKGDGFASEEEALAAAQSGRNIMPGWKIMPRLVGPVEFGSFTRWPRAGNSGTVMWRHAASESTQNRVGLKNPGAAAAAAFLALHRGTLPPCFGINIAPGPGVTDPEEEQREVLEALAAFVQNGIRPQWFTLNLSCPNTEDDPRGHQTEAKTHSLCGAAVDYLRQHAGDLPLWVKVSPELSEQQYHVLMWVFAEVGVRAVIATNTLPCLAPDTSGTAGLGGRDLQPAALRAVCLLSEARARANIKVDVIGCGGVMDGFSCNDYAKNGARAMQYWSALVYRGPLAAALIAEECNG